MGVEPVPGAPAAVAMAGGERLLVVADYHAGIEAVLRHEGVELDDGAAGRRRRIQGLLAETSPDRLVVLGDLVHAVGDPWDAEREEVTALCEGIEVPVTLVKGNHDGEVEAVLADVDHDTTVTPAEGVRFGDVGFTHGHTWPGQDVLAAEVVCVGHEHPVVRLADEVGGYRAERAWLRGRLAPEPFETHAGVTPDCDLVVFPAFNDRSGGTWANVDDRDFLSPFLPAGLADGQAYLLDGTRLGDYRSL
jgi:putative SbcD/Mre11-related phosphoesterase